MTAPKFVARGPKALTAHAGYIVTLFLAFAAALYSQANTNARLETQNIDTLNAIRAMRDERVALITQGNREKDQMRERIDHVEVRVDQILRDQAIAKAGK